MTEPKTPIEQVASELEPTLGHRARRFVKLDFATTYRIGGPVDVFVEVESLDELVELGRILRGRVEVFVVGRGSNVLVSDSGFHGVAVRLGRAFRTHEELGSGLLLGGAVPLPVAARFCARLGLAGFEFACEIPASFGGAVAMNAGAHKREMSDVVVNATTVDLNGGNVRTWATEDLKFAYRSSAVGSSQVVVSGEISLDADDPAAVGGRVAELLSWRRANQPGGRSAGSIFRNPPGDSAGRLIEAAGLKGFRYEGAQISEMHANFIVADRSATASDVYELVTLAQQQVAEKFGVELRPEIKFVGEFE